MTPMNKELPAEVKNWIGRQLFEQVPSNIVVIDRDYRVLAANGNFEEVFGEATGKHCYEVYKDRNDVCEQCMARRTFEDGKVRINDEEGFDRKGRRAHYVVQIAPVYDEVGEIAYVIEMSTDVTETKSLQREYNILFERVPCYVSVINRDLRIVRANELLRETFGDTVGEHCYEVYKHRNEQCTDCPAIKTFADGGSYHAEQAGLDKNGTPTNYVVSTAPLSRSDSESSHVIEMSVDVTDIHTLSHKLLKESVFRNSLIENSHDGLIAGDPSGIVNTFNPAAENIFKVAAVDVIGKQSVWKFYPPEFKTAIEQGDNRFQLLETTVADSDAADVPVRFTGTLLKDGDEELGTAAYFEDLRVVKKLEREKLDNERLAAVGQTVAQLAHGIKNILTGLQGGMYVLKSGFRSGDSTKTNKGWDMLDRNVDRITTMTKGFLSFSKGHTPDVRMTNPVEIAEEICNLYDVAASEKGIALELKPTNHIADAPMDEDDMHTCLANLVSNAIDACLSSEKHKCAITMNVFEENDMIVYEVSDTGCGMDYEIMNKVFTTFFTTKGLGGTGLGLMVTRKIVHEHGGQISVDSMPSEGSLFRIQFPRDRLPALSE
jgi:PAS domain S-box-containing protein